MRNVSTSSAFISSKNQAAAQCWHSEKLFKELTKTNKRFYDPGCSKGLQNPFYFATKAIKGTKFVSLNQKATEPVNHKIQDVLRKGIIVVSDSKENQFLSFLFLVKKRDGRNCLVVNLTDLNSSILYQYFKMEDLFLLKKMLLLGNKKCEANLQDACFAIFLSVKSRKYVRFQ